MLLGCLARESLLEDMARGFVGSGVAAAAVVLVRGGGVKAGQAGVSLAPLPLGWG